MRVRRPLFRLALLAALLTTTQLAGAHQLLNQGYTYINWGHNCTYGRTVLDHGHGGGWMEADVWSKVYFAGNGAIPAAECGDLLRRPGGWLAVRWILYRWNGATQVWDLCNYSNWSSPSTEAASYGIVYDAGSQPLCGAGYYGEYGIGYVYDGTAWQGKELWAGYHWLPAQ